MSGFGIIWSLITAHRSSTALQNCRRVLRVEPKVVEELQAKFEDFRRAFDEKGMTPGEFDDYGATRRTLRQFCKAVDDLTALIRDQVIPNPDA